MSPYPPNRARPKIDNKKLTEHLLAGRAMLVGEYRGTAVERIEYNDKQTGKKESFMKVTHTVEVSKADNSISVLAVEERALKGFDKAEEFVSGLTKGQRVALSLAGLQSVKGRLTASVPADDDAIAVLA